MIDFYVMLFQSEHSIESLSSIKGGEFLNFLSALVAT
jgi:hypothetical protein